MPIRPSSAKAKGRRLQQSIVEDIKRAFPTLTDADVVSTPMGEEGEDVKLSEPARKLMPFSVEAKNTERANVWQWIEQAESTNRPYEGLVIFKRNRSCSYALLKWETLLHMLKQIQQIDCRTPASLADTLEEQANVLNRIARDIRSA